MDHTLKMFCTYGTKNLKNISEEFETVATEINEELSNGDETVFELSELAEVLGLYCPSADEEIGGVEGYEALELVLTMAYQQASCGKGKERHAGGTPFHEQPMQRESDDIGSWDGMIFQSRKKIREGIKLPTEDRQVKELLGAIVYLSGAIIWKLRQEP